MPSAVTLRLELHGIDPVIWRSFQVPGTYTLAQLHRWIQQVMGWSDSQTYKFYDAMDDYTPTPLGHLAMDASTTTDVALVSVDDLIGRGSSFFYHYGVHWAGWRFELRVLSITTLQEVIHPTLLDGQCASPPEAAHGPQGYMEVLRQWSTGIVEPYVQAMLPPQFDPMRFDASARQRRVDHSPGMSLSTIALPQPPQSAAPAQPAPQRRPFGWLRQKSRILYDAARDGDVERFVDVLMLEMLRGEMDMVDRRRLINLFSSAEQLAAPITTPITTPTSPRRVDTTSDSVADSTPKEASAEGVASSPETPTPAMDAESHTETHTEPETTPQTTPDTKLESYAEPDAEPQTEPQVDPDAESQPEPGAEQQAETLLNVQSPAEAVTPYAAPTEDTTLTEAGQDDSLSDAPMAQAEVAPEDTSSDEPTAPEAVEPTAPSTAPPQSWHISGDVPTLPQIITLKKCLALLPDAQLHDMAQTLGVTTLDPERRVLEAELSTHLLQADLLMDIVRVTLSDAQTRLLAQICQMNGLVPQVHFQDDPVAAADAHWFTWSHDGDLSVLRRHGLVYLGRRGEMVQVVIPGGLLRLLRGVVKAVGQS